MTPFILILAFLVTAGSLLALQPVASRVGLLDVPGGRKLHSRPTPLTGGLGIYLGLLCAALLLPVAFNQHLSLLATAAFILLIGLIDDLRGMRVSLRFALHGLATWFMIETTGIRLESLGDLVFTGPVLIGGAVATAFTVFAVLGVINAINMSDGLDGLSGGLVLIALGYLSATALLAGETATLSLAQLLIVTLLAFLFLNFRPFLNRSALVYLGDAGSTLLGFILAWLMVTATQGANAFISPVTALWFLAVPLIDTVALLIRRPLRGISPFSAGRDHLHHKLLEHGLTHKQTVLALYGMAAITGGIGYMAHLAGVSDGTMFLAFLLLFAVYMRCTSSQAADAE